MKLFKVVTILALAALTLSVQFTSSCNGVLHQQQSFQLDTPFSSVLPASTSGRPTDTDRPVTSLDVMTYNVFMRPGPVSWGDANDCRATAIGKELAQRADKLDIVALNESFSKDAVDNLVETVGQRFPYRVLRRPEAKPLRVNGGVSLLSRFPIRDVYTQTYDACAFDDCLASKGFLHAVIEISDSLRVNVLASHLESGSSNADRRARHQQIQTIRDYMDKHKVGRDWPTLLMGDLNVDGIKGPIGALTDGTDARSEYRTMLSTLSKPCSQCADAGCSSLCGQKPADVVSASDGPWSFNADQTAPVNSLNCVDQSVAPCSSPNARPNWKKRERLDYILSFDQPRSSGVQLDVRDASHVPFRKDVCGGEYLSDHQAVEASFDINRPALVDDSPDDAPVSEDPTVADASESDDEGSAEERTR
ncbi:MAG: sphingomyelin phosphodiesterase [Bradymonadaceae bacterium]